MKKNICMIILSACLLSSSWIYAADTSLDKMIAIVNDDIITTSELNQAAHIYKLQLQEQGIHLPSEKVLRKQVLDQLINKRLQLQIVKEANIKISDADLNRAIDNIAKQNNMTLSEFYQRLATEGMSEATYKKEMREQMALQKLQQAEIINKIHITPEELKAYAKTLPQGKDAVTKLYRIEDILIPLSDTPNQDELTNAKKIAANIQDQLKANGNTQQVIKNYKSVTATDLGNKLISDLPTAFAQPVNALQKGDVAGPIQTGNGLHILRVVDLKSYTKKAAQPSQVELENRLGQHKMQEALQVWLAKIRSQAYIVNKLEEHANL